MNRRRRVPKYRCNGFESLEARNLLTVLGDANGDGRFDQLDLVSVLQADLYETGQPAGFEQGDWNEDGAFDRLDIVAVLQANTYQPNLSDRFDPVIVGDSGTNNVVVVDNVAYATAGSEGLLVVDLLTAAVSTRVAPPEGSAGFDDVAFADGYLFVMDGIRQGTLSVFSVVDPMNPNLVSGPVDVDVGPFSGVSARMGNVVVSGGTRRLTVLNYNADGELGDSMAFADLGVGQPDVTLAPDGKHAIVSTDFSGRVDGQRFGVTVVELNAPPEPPSTVSQIGIAGAGFTPGVQGPANFPIESDVLANTVFTTFSAGVAVIDIENPSESIIQDDIELPFNPISVDVAGTALYVVGNSPSPSLAIIDIRDIGAPIVSQIIDLAADGRPLGVSAGMNYVVVADANLGLLIIDLS